MKKSRNEQTDQNKAGYFRKPDIRDNLDSRKNEEFRTKKELKDSIKKNKHRKPDN